VDDPCRSRQGLSCLPGNGAAFMRTARSVLTAGRRRRPIFFSFLPRVSLKSPHFPNDLRLVVNEYVVRRAGQ
jgi:hypothetical protein